MKYLCIFVQEVASNILDKHLIRGIGFDATCSLVALDCNGQPVSLSRSGDVQRNIVMWLDHRAINQVGAYMLLL